MRALIKVAALVVVAATGFTPAAHAQRDYEPPLLTSTARCFTLVNKSGHRSFGTISTRQYVDQSGKMTFYTDNFHLDDGERREVCSSGPFYPGYQLELRLRSLIPLWTCYVPTDEQEVDILSRRTADGRTKMYASCKATWEK